MFQTMEQCTSFIFSLKASQFKGKPLEAATKLLHALGNPHEGLRYIHFAGSNGKGSTLNATREILIEHGLQVGAFTSPHLVKPNERITINHVQISDEAFLSHMNRLDQAVHEKLDGQYPSFFEVMTVLAFMYFAQQKPDVVLLETGIGGRIDTTNVITPVVSVITTISLEHTDLLGDTHEKIAFEKAGIIKAGKPVVVGVKHTGALAVIRNQAQRLDAPYYQIGDNIHVAYGKKTFDYQGLDKTYKQLALAMEGKHQMDNASLAITASLLFDGSIKEQTIRDALTNAKWLGRFERIGQQIIIDGAHNSEGTAALISTLKLVEPNKRYHFIYVAMKDKDHGESIALMDRVATSMSFTELDMPRAATAQMLANQSTCSDILIEKNWQKCIDKCLLKMTKDDVLVITGSLYFIGEARPFLLAKEITQ